MENRDCTLMEGGFARVMQIFEIHYLLVYAANHEES